MTNKRSPQLTNQNVHLPLSTLYELPNILTPDESTELLKSLEHEYYREWCPEGYDRRHRVQRYSTLGNENVPTSNAKCNSTDGSSVDHDDDDHDCRVGEDGDSSGDKKKSMEDVFGWIFDRILSHDDDKLLHRPFEVIVIEHTPLSCQSVVNTFEQNTLCPCCRRHDNDDDCNCNCYIAQLVLTNNAIQQIEKPIKRELECWDLALPIEEHTTSIVMKQNSVIIKKGNVLWNWRGRISNVCTNDELDVYMDNMNMKNDKVKKKNGTKWTRTKSLKESEKRCIIVTFRGIRSQPPTTKVEQMKQQVIMSVPKQVKPTPTPLSQLLTIIVTTSPIRSNPSTEMLQQTFDTFLYGGTEFAYECPKVIICDGCRVYDKQTSDELRSNNDHEEKKQDESGGETTMTYSSNGTINNSNMPLGKEHRVSRKHSNIKQKLRNGITTIDQAKNYTEFKCRLHKLCQDANNNNTTNNDNNNNCDSSSSTTKKKKSPFNNTKVVELQERHGYGFALRHALYHCVQTPYVCVIQHDRTFMRQTPIKQVVQAMESDPEQRVKYVGMSMRSNLMYHDIFSGKYGRRAVDEFQRMILRPRELYIGNNVYGMDGTSVEDMLRSMSTKRQSVLRSLKETYKGSHQYITYDEQSKHLQEGVSQEGQQQTINKDGYHQLTLTPTLFWYDNTHIVQTSHYRDFIFNPRYKMVARGGFVEDKLSPCLVRSCERLGLYDGHAKFGCYLLDDHSGVPLTGHLDGGSFKSSEDWYKNKYS